jgi:ubiquinol-cytochrome c reductase cytochrome b subunit
LGGGEADVVPLYRGYALHVWFLPMLMFVLVALHLLVVWKQGLMEIPTAWRRWQEMFPRSRWLNLLPGLTLVIILLTLSAITPHSDEVDPAARSVWPHPDWLLMFYFLPFWFFKGEMRIVGTLVIPAALLIFLALAPRLAGAGIRPRLGVGLAIMGIVGVIWLFGQTSKMGYEVPLPGCNACHRSSIIGGAPGQLSEFEIRDPDWIVFHLQDPQGSLLLPFSTPSAPPESKHN